MDHRARSSRADPAGDDFQKILDRAKAGDEAAWRALFGIMSGRVVAFLVARGARDVEGLAGDVFADIVRSIHRFSGDRSSFVSWSITIAHRRLIDSHRASSRRLELVTSPEELDQIDPSDDHDPVARLTAALQARELLDQLTDDQADVILLRIYGDLTLPQIASHLGKPLTAVKSLQHRALERLRKLLESP